MYSISEPPHLLSYMAQVHNWSQPDALQVSNVTEQARDVSFKTTVFDQIRPLTDFS